VNYSEVPWGLCTFQWITVKFPKDPVHFSELQWISLGTLYRSVNYSEVPWGPLSFSELQWSSLGPFVFQWVTVKFPGVLCLSVNYSEVPWGPLSFSELQWSSLGPFVFQWVTVKFSGILCLSINYSEIPLGSFVCQYLTVPFPAVPVFMQVLTSVISKARHICEATQPRDVTWNDTSNSHVILLHWRVVGMLIP
jgi:hypothetical protein